MSSGYIYLLQPLRSITDNKNIYKIGKTKRNNYKRFNEYPVGSILLLQSSCKNCDLMETHLLKLFTERFVKETDYGREYFNGDLIEMKNLINSEIIKENNDLVSGLSSQQLNLEVKDQKILVEKCENLDNLPKISENVKKYNCVNCNYIGCRQSQYDRHLLTAKHIKMTDRCKIGSDHTCSCGKSFKYRQGLHKHKIKCFPYSNKNVITENPVIDTNLIIKLIQQNENLQNLLVQHFRP